MRRISLWAALFIWLSVCVRCTAPQSDIKYPPINQLLIDGADFPDGWEATEPNWEHPPHAPWSGPTSMVEYIDRGFYTRSGQGAAAGITIQQFDSLQAAVREYKRKAEIAFRDKKWNTPWMAPSGLLFESSIADQYRYGCSEVFDQPRCVYVAQYEVYVLSFDISLYDTNAITYTDLLTVFQAIDKRMEQHMGDR